jgi:hydroxymethylbilane synthase
MLPRQSGATRRWERGFDGFIGMKIRIGTRGSKLALAQSRRVKEQIESRHPQVRVELVTIKTTGDKILDTPLSRVGGKGLFVKEIEEALLDKTVDLAVHSLKDVPGEVPEGLLFPVFPQREDPRDAFISANHHSFSDLPQGACLGTSSLRRKAQILHLRPDLTIVPLRGNVDTRLRKLDSGEMDAIILAVAGLRRLGLSERITEILPIGQMIPAVGQGALGLETRRDDEKTIKMIQFLHQEETATIIRAERAFLRELEGGCQVPLAAAGRLQEGKVHLLGLVAEEDGSRIIRDELEGEQERAEEIGVFLARKLLDAGADGILDRIYRSR